MVGSRSTQPKPGPSQQPTNDLVVRDEHVLLGWGRDYADISPVTGILLGGGKQALDVSVDLVEAGDATPP